MIAGIRCAIYFAGAYYSVRADVRRDFFTATSQCRQQILIWIKPDEIRFRWPKLPAKFLSLIRLVVFHDSINAKTDPFSNNCFYFVYVNERYPLQYLIQSICYNSIGNPPYLCVPRLSKHHTSDIRLLVSHISISVHPRPTCLNPSIKQTNPRKNIESLIGLKLKRTCSPLNRGWVAWELRSPRRSDKP